jgi:hypothetical protein
VEERTAAFRKGGLTGTRREPSSGGSSTSSASSLGAADHEGDCIVEDSVVMLIDCDLVWLKMGRCSGDEERISN